MSELPAASVRSVSASSLDDMEDYQKPSLQSLSRTSRHLSPKAGVEGELDHNDSGVGNSTCCKTPTGSTSDTDDSDSRAAYLWDYVNSPSSISSKNNVSSACTNNNMDPESRGVFDYYPVRENVPLTGSRRDAEIKRKNDMAYDETFDANEDISEALKKNAKDTSYGTFENETAKHRIDSAYETEYDGETSITTVPSIISMRSSESGSAMDYQDDGELQEVTVVNCTPKYSPPEDSNSTEMKTFRIQSKNNETRRRNDMQYDESVVVDGDEEGEEGVASVSLHQRLYGGGRITKAAAYTPMDFEESEEYHGVRSSFGRPSPDREFCNASRFRSDGLRTSNRSTNIDETVSFPLFRNNSMNSSCSVKNSLGSDRHYQPQGGRISLESGSAHYSSLNPDEMEKTRKDLDNQSATETNKKKKKKKKNKDDGGGEKEASYDVNGNPVEERLTNNNRLSHLRSAGTNARPLDSYSSSSDSRPLQPRQPSRLQSSQFPSNPKHFTDNHYPYTEQEDGPTLPDAKGRRKKKDKKKEVSITAESYPGFRGSDNVDDLMAFIENTGNKKPGVVKKKVATPAPTVQNGPVVGEKDKNNKKNKNKKAIANNSMDKGSENGSERGDDASSKLSEMSDEKMKDFVSEGGSVSSDTKTKDFNSEAGSINCDLKDHSTAAFSKLDDTVDDDILNTDYIFTDIEILKPPQEEDFQQVTKKKKKGPQKSQPTQRDMHNDFHKDTAIHISREPSRRRRISTRSKTPPPTSTTTIAPEKCEQRAFSPSAFPVLGVGGRRASAGDVTEEITPDDSDIESVKSLPLGTGAGAHLDGTTSPLGGGTGTAKPACVSYAKMAAASRTKSNTPGGGVANSSGNTSKVVAGETGSSDGGLEEECSNRDSVESDMTTSSTNMPETAPDLIVDFPSLGETHNINSQQKDKQINLVKEKAPPADARVPTSSTNGQKCSEQPKRESRFEVNVSNSEFSHSTELVKPVSNHPMNPEASSTQRQAKAVPVVVNVSTTMSNTTPSIPVAGTIHTTKNNRKPKAAHKSVVFMDEMAGEPANNLGISFGFEEEFGGVNENVESSIAVNGSTQYSPAEGTDNTQKQYQVEFLEADFPPLSNCHAPCGQTELPLPADSENNTKNIGGMNGLVVIPSSQGPHIVMPPSVTKHSIESIINPKDGAGICFTSDDVDQETSCHSQTEGRMINLSKLQELPHYNDANLNNGGNFIVEDAAAHFIKEWNRVCSKMEKNPASVFVYSE